MPTRQNFAERLQRLQDEVLVLGSMVEDALSESVELLKRRDLEGSKRLIANDRLINEKRFAIESECLVLLATQQPMAGDLRTLAAVLEIATELERIGDYTKGIAQINVMMGGRAAEELEPNCGAGALMTFPRVGCADRSRGAGDRRGTSRSRS